MTRCPHCKRILSATVVKEVVQSLTPEEIKAAYVASQPPAPLATFHVNEDGEVSIEIHN